MLSKISVSEDEEHDQHDLDIEIIPQDDLDLDPTPIPNKNPEWAQNLIEAVGNGVRNPNDRRKMRSQYQNESVALSQTSSLPTEWCNKLPGRCSIMIVNDLQFVPVKKKMDHSSPPPERRDKRNIQQIKIIWKGSHA